MVRPVPFREQLEALLVIPSPQAASPGPQPPATPPSEVPPAEPAAPEESQEVAPPLAGAAPEVPSFLQLALAETLEAGRLPVPQDPLPFLEPDAAGPAGARLAPPSGPRPPQPFTGTVDAQMLPVPGRVMPFEGPGSADSAVENAKADPLDALVIEGMSLKDHAALCADLAAHPAQADRLFAARGLADPTKRRTADQAWRAHLAGNPIAYARWQDLFRRHQAGSR